MIHLPEKCCRNEDDKCNPLSQIASDDLDEKGQPFSFMCCGCLDSDYSADYDEPGVDKYVFCFKNDEVDEKGYYDYRDMIDTVSVLVQGISIIQNCVSGKKYDNSKYVKERFE